MEFMRIAENHPTLKSGKKTMIRGTLKRSLVLKLIDNQYSNIPENKE